MASTLGTAWWFPTPLVDGKSIDYPPPGGAPGPGSSSHFPGGRIGYAGFSTKTALPNKTAVFWKGFIISDNRGQKWFKGPNVPAAEIIPFPGHAGYANSNGTAASRKRRGMGTVLRSPWAGIRPLITPDIMWYDNITQKTIGYWITHTPIDVHDGTGPAFRLLERTTSDGLVWSTTAPIRRNISMLELAKTQCTGLSGTVDDNRTALGRCVHGDRTKNSQAMPGFNLTVFESWRASFGANGNTFVLMPNGTLVIWLVCPRTAPPHFC